MSDILCSLLIPTRWRPKIAEDCVRSIFDTASNKNRVETMVRVHANDAETNQAIPRISRIHPNTKIVVSGLEGTWQALAQFHNELIQQARGKWLWFLNDDVTFEGNGWDDHLAGVPTDKHIVYPEFDMLDTSRYHKTIGGPFPCVPNGSWGSEPFLNYFGGFNIDTSMHYLYNVNFGWNQVFIPGLTIHHHRADAMKYRKEN